MKVVRLRATEPRPEPSVAVGAAMREAQAAAGLDDCQAAAAVNAACGTTVITAALWRCWTTGAEIPDAVVFLQAVRLAGVQAARILAGLG